jgi:hypothetical protein
MDEEKIKKLAIKITVILAITFILECAYLFIGEVKNKERCGYDKFNILERIKCVNMNNDNAPTQNPFNKLNITNFTYYGR